MIIFTQNSLNDNLFFCDVFKWAEKVKADGRIGQLGFSFHDDYELFKEVVDGYDNWELCQIQYNFLNENVQAGTKGFKYAAEKGLPVVKGLYNDHMKETEKARSCIGCKVCEEKCPQFPD